MLTIECRKPYSYWMIVIRHDATSIDLGAMNDVECKELAAELREVADTIDPAEEAPNA